MFGFYLKNWKNFETFLIFFNTFYGKKSAKDDSSPITCKKAYYSTLEIDTFKVVLAFL